MNGDSKIVVFDLDSPTLLNNQVFNIAEAVKISHTYLPTCFLYQEAKKRGIDFITPDVYFSLADKPKKVLLMTHLQSSYTGKLIQSGVISFILTCQESPFIASRFYVGLKGISAQYRHSFVFSGMEKRLSRKTVFHEMHFPIYFDGRIETDELFENKKLSIMVSSAKGISDWRKDIILKILYGSGVKEVNNVRRQIISFFSRKNAIDLFGSGWHEASYNDLINFDIKNCYRGFLPFSEKVSRLGKYKFVFCFENSIFPGYVTEKIFDAMIAGSVPVYYGAPDIGRFVDPGAFIDYRKYENFDKLHDYLMNMTEAEYQGYIDSIASYLESEKFSRFTHIGFSREILGLIEKEFGLIQ